MPTVYEYQAINESEDKYGGNGKGNEWFIMALLPTRTSKVHRTSRVGGQPLVGAQDPQCAFPGVSLISQLVYSL